MSPLPRRMIEGLCCPALLLLAACGAGPAPQPFPAPAARPDSFPRPNIDPGDARPAPVEFPAESIAGAESLALPPPVLVRAALPVHLALTGDINLGTITLPDGVPPDSGRGLLSAVDSLLTGDLVVGNFEGVLADSGLSPKCGPPPAPLDSAAPPRGSRTKPLPVLRPRPHCYAFGTPTYLARRLADAGFTHLNLANNHANDFGLPARLATQEIFTQLGLKSYGPLDQISIDTVRRGDSVTVIGLLGFATYPFAYDLLDLERSAQVVDSVRRLVDVLVVTFHGGAEGVSAVRTGTGPEFLAREERGDLRRWARVVIDAGADAVIGHGPHVLRGVEFYGGKPIFYSLGNFATYRGFNLVGPLGVTGVLQLELEGNGRFRTARMVPLVQRPQAGPEPDPHRAAVRVLQRLTRLDFGAGGARISDQGVISPP